MGNSPRMKLASIIYQMETRQYDIVDVIQFLKSKDTLSKQDIDKVINRLKEVRFGMHDDAEDAWNVFDNRRRDSIQA
jgi:hypothetical protein